MVATSRKPNAAKLRVVGEELKLLRAKQLQLNEMAERLFRQCDEELPFADPSTKEGRVIEDAVTQMVRITARLNVTDRMQDVADNLTNYN